MLNAFQVILITVLVVGVWLIRRSLVDIRHEVTANRSAIDTFAARQDAAAAEQVKANTAFIDALAEIKQQITSTLSEQNARLSRDDARLDGATRTLSGLNVSIEKLANLHRTNSESLGDISAVVQEVRRDQLAHEIVPRLNVTNLLSGITFEQFFAPPQTLAELEDGPTKDGWLTILMGSSNFALQLFESVKTFTERYGAFPHDLEAKLASGAAQLMESAEGSRWIVMEGGKIIGQGIMRIGPTLAQGAASIMSTVLTAAYMLVAKDTLNHLRNMNEALDCIQDAELRSRYSRLEADYEMLRHVSQAGYSQDRAVVLSVIHDLHTHRAYFRRQIIDEHRMIEEPGFWKSILHHDEVEDERVAHFNSFRAELLLLHQVFRLQAIAISMLNEPSMESSFVRTVAEEADRLELMSSALNNSWAGDEGRIGQPRPVILDEVEELSALYRRGLLEVDGNRQDASRLCSPPNLP